MWVPAIVSLFVFGGLFTYTRCERRHRSKWLRRRAPEQIRNTALWSIYMGQMAVPGGLLGLYGTLFTGIGLVSIPGMILAIRIWRLGYALLRRDPKAEQEARKLDAFALVLNFGIMVAVTVMFVLRPSAEVAGLWLFLAAYAGVSIVHARAMRRCADILEAERQFDAATLATPAVVH